MYGVSTAIGVRRRSNVFELADGARLAESHRLLEQCVELTAGTLHFLQRLVGVPNPVYGARGLGTQQHSVLVDSRA